VPVYQAQVNSDRRTCKWAAVILTTVCLRLGVAGDFGWLRVAARNPKQVVLVLEGSLVKYLFFNYHWQLSWPGRRSTPEDTSTVPALGASIPGKF
jgi:hypothetical protein